MLNFCRIFILTLLLGGLFIQQGYCADRYYWLGSDDNITYSLDTQTFTTNKDSTWLYINTWVKWKYNESGVKKKIESNKKYGLSTVGYEKLSYSLYHEAFAISQSRKMWKTIQSIDYDVNGNTLYNYTFDSTDKFQDIPPGTVIEYLADTINDYHISSGK